MTRIDRGEYTGYELFVERERDRTAAGSFPDETEPTCFEMWAYLTGQNLPLVREMLLPAKSMGKGKEPTYIPDSYRVQAGLDVVDHIRQRVTLNQPPSLQTLIRWSQRGEKSQSFPNGGPWPIRIAEQITKLAPSIRKGSFATLVSAQPDAARLIADIVRDPGYDIKLRANMAIKILEFTGYTTESQNRKTLYEKMLEEGVRKATQDLLRGVDFEALTSEELERLNRDIVNKTRSELKAGIDLGEAIEENRRLPGPLDPTAYIDDPNEE